MKNQNYKNKTFLTRLGFALNGIKLAGKNESSFRFQLFAGVLVIMVLAGTKAPAFWWIIFFMIIALILSAELFNTALENALDKLNPDYHPQIKIAKDCAAGAVLILSLISILLFFVFIAVHILKLFTIT